MEKTVLYMISPESYDKKLVKIVKETKGYATIYVATTKDATQLNAIFKKNKVDTSRFFFIDYFRKQQQTRESPANIISVTHPENLTEISITITEAIRRLPGKKMLILDSLSSLLVYNSSGLVSKFANFLIHNLRAHKINGILIVLDSERATNFVVQIGSACDEVRRI